MRKRLTPSADVANVALAWALSRAFVWLFVMSGHIRMRSLPHPWPSEEVGSWVGVGSYWLNPWTLFDSAHYIGIAHTGYLPDAPWRSVFFPLYPLLMRLIAGVNASDNTMALVGILISNLSFAGALWMLFRLTRDEWGEAVAKRAVWIQAFFPAVAFSAAVYTESLFLLLSISFFWLARQKKWWLCGVFGLLCGLTRNSGPVLFLALLLDRPKEPLSRREKTDRAVCAFTPLIGFLCVQYILRSQYGTTINSTSMQTLYGRTVTFPWVPVWFDIKQLIFVPETWLNFLTAPALIGVFGTYTLIWMYRKRFSAGKLLFLGAVLLASLSLSWQGEVHTISTLRYVFGAFPAAQLLALFSTEKIPSRRVTLYLATAAFMLFFIHSYLVGMKNFMG